MVGKWVLFSGLLLVVVGAVIWLAESLGLPLGRLPGDINARGHGWSFSFPMVTCVLASLVLTMLVNIMLWIMRR